MKEFNFYNTLFVPSIHLNVSISLFCCVNKSILGDDSVVVLQSLAEIPDAGAGHQRIAESVQVARVQGLADDQPECRVTGAFYSLLE